MENCVKVCVTGGAGYLASFLIKHLLLRGYTVHATLRSLNDASKVELLMNLIGAEKRLKLFEADIYKPNEFEAAIIGCEFVFHLATPMQHIQANSQYKNTIEAAEAGVRFITESCIKSKTVKKLIYASTVLAASPLKDDGSGYKEVVDETCWNPPNLTYDAFNDYIESKIVAEKNVLSYDGKGVDVVSLVIGLVGGDTIQSHVSSSMCVLIAQTLKGEDAYKGLRGAEELLSKLAIVHVEDVIEAHIFCMENSGLHGRFLCANAFLKSAEIAALIRKCHPDITIPPEFIEDTKRETKWGSRKLEDLGFHYKFDAEKIIDDTIICCKRLQHTLSVQAETLPMS